MIQFGVAIALAAQLAARWQPFPVQFSGVYSGRSVTVCIDGRRVETTMAGKLAFRSRAGSWLSLCANVRGPIRAGQAFRVQPLSTAAAGGSVGLAGRIVSRYFNAAQTPDQCAGLQLAVWEAIEDGGTYPNFSGGSFAVRASPAVLAFAASYYQTDGTESGALFLSTQGGSGQSQINLGIQ